MPSRSAEFDELVRKSPHKFVWEPLEIGPVRVRHRIMQSPHGVAWDNNLPYDRQLRFFEERARGGAALVCVGATPVLRAGAGDPEFPTTVSERSAVALYSKLADAIHGHEAAVFVELGETGVHASGRRFDGNWGPIYGASQVPSVALNEAPAPIDKRFIRDLRSDFVQAAKNLREAGIDGLYVHAAHSYLFGQFLSPAYNFRSDEYGGSTANRCRLLVEVAQDIRDGVGDAIAVGVRLSYDEFAPYGQGITPELSDEYLHALTETGLFDFFDISAGGYHSLERAVPAMHAPLAHIAADAERAKAIVGDTAKIFVAGRVLSVSSAEELLRRGQTDMVGMARAHIADPFLVQKTLEGREDEITTCIGSNECIFTLVRGLFVSCTVNPSAGRETEWGGGGSGLALAARARRVLVVGAGPAGLRAAQVAAARGHVVTLLDENEAAGGSLRLFSRLPSRGGWQVLIDDHLRQLERLEVELRLGERATRDSVLACHPDVVIVATGSQWDPTGYTPALPARAQMPGADLADVFTYGDAVARALVEPTSLGSRVVIIDETADYYPLALAEQLATAGVSVELVSRHPFVGELAAQTWELAPALRRLAHLHVHHHPQTVVRAVAPSIVTLQSIWGGATNDLDRVDSVVLAMLRQSQRALFDELADAAGVELHLIGDALAPRRPADAVYEGERIGRAV